MSGKTTRIRSSDGGDFDCYLAIPGTDRPVPAIVIASAIHGVDDDVVAIADEFAVKGFIAAAPDLFWRSIAGPLSRDDARASERSQPRLEKIAAGERDMADTLRSLVDVKTFNGRAVAMGLCYGGPYAILGPKRLGYAAGISCHGTKMLDYIGEIEGVDKPICVIWGDHDHAAPIEVRDPYRALASRNHYLEEHTLPGVGHGYMTRGNRKAFDPAAYEFSMGRALAALERLTESGP